MVKPRGALKKGRAADGKLNSHLQWPNTEEIFIPLTIYKFVQNKAWLRVYAREKAWLRKAGLCPLHMAGD